MLLPKNPSCLRVESFREKMHIEVLFLRLLPTALGVWKRWRRCTMNLSNCALNAFPTGLYVVMSNVAQDIHFITLANNELKSLTSKFFTSFTQLRELNLEGNNLRELPKDISTLMHLKSINLSRNKFQEFPEKLLNVNTLESINLEDNQIKDVPVEKLTSMPSLRCVNLKANALNKDNLQLSSPTIKFELLV
ncbi:leucine-rich repeat-containing protein 20 isoform X2 [Ascaphus truei]|uniref:leucine-rich repeat-containing protein 20 isoform X2 n=1 Tax=Ascaphus truei TaxID=8439 RepID=UPI003F5A83AC